MKAVFGCLLLASALVLSAADVDVTGKWSGSFDASGPDGQSKASTALLDLTQKGTAISGTIGPNEDERFTITKGTLDGEKITLDVDDGNGHQIHIALVLAGDHLKGDAHMSAEGQTRTAKIDVTRSK
jgi:hypothetical protein